MAQLPVLETRRFRMRAIDPQDVDAFWPTFSDDAQMRYMTRAAFATREELADWLLADGWGGRTWVAEPLAGGAPVARIIAMEGNPGVAEIGYVTCKDHAGQGIARECTARLITHLFDAEGHHRVFADTDPRNHASNRLLGRLGFTREAHLRGAMETHIGWTDSWIWGLLHDERNPDAIL
jgi:RimJ/RimL family protein N-acetyltransferase